ncbi:anthranilate phosphoribosyltransferase [Tautonia sociabilis]|uniref:Anthranilate phosphoribosyltransferase n=1 Tax=Tautonia sociabilis TaxID=2080755 RepID=A0A432MH93_9BACT|nr:anthranilate phosphoribosyltransferase [Tautonia sociabilis]
MCSALETIGDGRHLTREACRAAVARIVDGQASEAALAAFLAGLRVKGETDAELAGAVDAVRSRMTPFEPPRRPVLDTCGTGGDGSSSLNVSTATAIVSAASGAIVAKHGNRSASGVSGSSDVLERLGVAIDPGPELLADCLDELGLAFFFAPRFHPALKHAAAVRKQLPFRTLFNLVGPLANPARPDYQLVGVPDRRLALLMAAALSRLGVTRAAVVTGPEGLDEVGLSGPTEVLWVESGRIEPASWTPEQFGLPPVRAEQLRVCSPEQSAALIREVLDGQNGPARHVILANSAAALMVAGLADDPSSGVKRAAEAIDSGKARALLDRWARFSLGSSGPRASTNPSPPRP